MLDSLATVPNLNRLTGLVTAVGALGAAAYGLVDVTKALGGGVSNRGFTLIRQTMATLVPDTTVRQAEALSTDEPAPPPALSLQSMLVTLRSNWINGMDASAQIAIAKSLVKLRLTTGLAPSLAALTGVDALVLAEVARKLGSGAALLPTESDVYAQFDLVLTTLLDQTYQRADQQYRNTAKLTAVIFSVLLAILGAWSLGRLNIASGGIWQAVLLGLLATPLAPVAKDLASAIQAGARAAQSWRS